MLRQKPYDLGPWIDLAPEIVRQRLVVEGIPSHPIDADQITAYLHDLAEVTDMVVLTEPVTNRCEQFGWAGWVHWETSGAHFYAWEQPKLFFSVDIYTCKAFDPEAVVAFTCKAFDTLTVAAREF